MGEPVQLTAWIDVLDPWSYVVATRLDRLVADLGDRVAVTWRAFVRLDEKQQVDADEFRKGTIEWMEPAGAEPELTFSLWATTDPPPTHSAPALVALKVAEVEDPALADAFRRSLFDAFFGENRTVSDSAVLIDVARRVGYLDDAFAMRLRGMYRDHLKQVLLDDHEARQRGIDDCPAVVVGGTFLVKGPATLEQYRDLVEKVERGETDHGAEGTAEGAEGAGLRDVTSEVEIEGRTFRFGPVVVEEPAAT